MVKAKNVNNEKSSYKWVTIADKTSRHGGCVTYGPITYLNGVPVITDPHGKKIELTKTKGKSYE